MLQDCVRAFKFQQSFDPKLHCRKDTISNTTESKHLTTCKNIVSFQDYIQQQPPSCPFDSPPFPTWFQPPKSAPPHSSTNPFSGPSSTHTAIYTHTTCTSHSYDICGTNSSTPAPGSSSPTPSTNRAPSPASESGTARGPPPRRTCAGRSPGSRGRRAKSWTW